MSSARPVVVVIGGGYSETATACQLAQRTTAQVILVEPRAALGQGVAYGVDHHALLLNVPADNMSALAGEPGHFVAWLAARGDATPPSGFAPRAIYGQYLAELIAAPIADGRVLVRHQRVEDLAPTADGFALTLTGGGTLAARAVVLALGNPPARALPRLAGLAGSPRMIDDPWSSLARFAPRPDDTIALLGTGLTALDVVVWLRERGHRGNIIAMSRRGLVPLARVATGAAVPVPPGLLERPGLLAISRWLRRHGVAGVAALRNHTATLWLGLSSAERRGFLRHARAYWEIARHRAAPASHAVFTDGLRDGWLELVAARPTGARVTGDGLQLTLRPRGAAAERTVDAAWVVNCTGPERDLRQVDSALVRSLLARRLVHLDPLALGANLGPHGELLDASGATVPRAFVVGPWRIADLWESAAVPDLRHHVDDVAATVAASL